MHILIISSEPYKIPTVPLGGIFQQHQAVALNNAGLKVGIASGGLLPFRNLATFLGRPTLEQTETLLAARYFTKSFLPLRFSLPSHIHEKNIDNLVKSIEIYIKNEGVPDCLHAHNLQYAGVAGHSISIKFGIPLVITEHSSSFLTNSFPQELLKNFEAAVNHATTSIAVSTSLARKLNKVFSLKNKLFTVVPNVIDLNLPTFSINKNNNFTFLSIGRLDANKNHQLLIHAFAKAFKDTQTTLRIGGVGEEESNLRKLAKKLLVDHQITFLGFLSREQVARELEFAHCFVLPSTKETFGVVVVEALSKGLPVISTPSGGPSDILNHSNGIITQDHSVDSFCNALLDMRQRINSFDSNQIKNDAYSQFSPESFSNKMIDIYTNSVKINSKRRT